MDTTIENSIVCEAKSKTGKTSNLLAKRKLKKKKDPEHIVSIYRIYLFIFLYQSNKFY